MDSDKVQRRWGFSSSEFDIPKGGSLLSMERVPSRGGQHMVRSVRVSVTGEVPTEEFVTHEPALVIEYVPCSWRDV
ncbi:hypothetical protein [Candidatus Solincola sp.]|nr:hypothetical protein [Actinomycetota bacterium]MDI7251116.1 hypothetical protein [Actinomycetota bacterium]